MSRQVYLLGLGLALVALALAFTDLALSLQPGVTEANARRVSKGMTSGQVEAIFGGPPQEGVRWRGLHSISPDGTVAVRSPDGGWSVWTGTYGKVMVDFDEEDRVAGCVFEPNVDPPAGPLARLRSWLDW
jgi:hypothetical protein